METVYLPADIPVLYVTASSFPAGIMAAHEELHNLVALSSERKYFGISRPENGNIVYRAAAEELTEGEATQLHCGRLVLVKGNYTCSTIRNYAKDIQSIERSFAVLLQTPGLDPQGYCVEWYINETDVICMVRLQEQ